MNAVLAESAWACLPMSSTQTTNGMTMIMSGKTYHKHPCVAVLGRGEDAESQLYEWLMWFDANGFKVETGIQPVDPKLGAIAFILGKHTYQRMVRFNA